MAKPLTEIVSIKPVANPDKTYHFVARFSGDKSDFTSNLDATVTVTAGDLLEYDVLKKVVLEQTGLYLRISGADDQRSTWLDRLEKFLEMPPK